GEAERLVEARTRRRLVYEVDGLVREVAAGQAALAVAHGHLEHLVRDDDSVMRLVLLTQADEDLERLLGGRPDHDAGLEPPPPRGVLLYVAVVLAGRGRAYDLDLAAGERRLEDVRGVKGAFGAARSDQRVQLVDERDDPSTTQLLDDLTQALLELAAVLRAGDDVGEVDGEDAHAAQVGGDATLDDRLGEALDDGRLAYAWLAYEHGV